jgi:hypothetical protein
MILFTFVLAEEVIGKYIPDFLMRLGDIFLYLIHTLMNNGIGSAFASLGIEDGYVRFLFPLLHQVCWLVYHGGLSSVHSCRIIRKN